MAQLKCGIAGFGKMGQIRAREIAHHPDTVLTAVFETNPDYAANIPSAVTQCQSFDELLNADLDALFVCAFNNVAAIYTKQGLEKGLHVFCEKPPAKTSAELATVIATEADSDRVLKYGFNHRLHYSVSQAKQLIERREFGRLIWMRGVYGKAGSIDYHENWRNFKNYSGGGILMDQGIHMLDLFHHLSGLSFDVTAAQLSKGYWDVDVEDNAFVTLKSGDVIATLHSSATQWKHKFLLEMCFENGFINLDGILSESRSYAPEKLVTGKREFEDITFAMGKPAEQTVWFENDDSWRLEHAEFVAAILNDQPLPNGNSEDALKVLSLIEDIYAVSGFYDN
ncbi:Gfo/Idh/MocA family oxidoreductase [Alteromonas sp. ASW11-36]|uniref:Gfo/Idh/MocA family oxidoreductase n=1 Tax=Alteromonas arenosi TaxID=3055817 RepID=A0ABT7SVC0_9ALTE|nr:Gfo/Idh/MocA family oxidoreductase [Alteromonas sp. ASW11-36]MDM7860137.1 Gfo/Idh/MocA family oxidoreductase [Alteromonas sp. ASW11-36]